MKKTFIYFFSFLLLCGTSCTDVLDQSAVDAFDEDVVFSDINLVKAYIGACYSMLGSTKPDGNAINGPLIRRDFLSSSTDHTLSNFRPAEEVFLKGSLTPDNFGTFSNRDNGKPWLYWEHIYRTIQNVNTILSRIDEVPVTNASQTALRDQLKGEAYFLRALSYTWLITCYGGAILTDKPFKTTDDFSGIRRSSIVETKEFILADVNKAIEFLPASIEQGRGSRGAAAAVRSRMLMFCASLLTNGGLPGEATNPLVSFPAGSQATLLREARDAAKDIIDGKYGKYALVGETSEPVLPLSEEALQRYADAYFSIFHQSSLSAWNSEIIWGTQFVETLGGRTYHPTAWCSPRGWDGMSNNAPTEDLIRRYEMADGSKFVWDAANPGDKYTMRRATAAELAANPYLNPYYGREARFYASVMYHNAPYVLERPNPVRSVDPYNRLQLAYRYRMNATGAFPENPSYSGLDTRQSSNGFNTAGNASKTGYNLRKFIDPGVDANKMTSLNSSNTVWVEFRFAEILLNYAEACIELGGTDLQAGIDAMNIVRRRAGLPGRVTTNQDEARAFVRHEREIEFVGEGHRFYDIRRWMIAKDVIVDVHHMRINEYVATNDDYNVLETSWQLLRGIEDARPFGGNHLYWLPIVRAEINKVPGLQQNPGYK